MKTRYRSTLQPRTLLLSAFMLALMATTTATVVAATGDVISVQLGLAGSVVGSGGAVTNQPLGATELTGAFPTTNWNALAVAVTGNGAGWTEQSFALNDRNGIASGVNLIVLGANDARYLKNPPKDKLPITKLLNTYITGWYPPSQGAANLLGEGTMQLVLNNLDNNQVYNVYVYLMDNLSKGADVDARTGVTNYTGALYTTVTSNSTFIASVNQDPNGTRDRGNYVHLTGITPVSGSITITVNYDDPTWTSYGVGVCGLQLVTATVDLVRPSITAQPANRTVYTNVAATFSVAASGVPAPTVQWYQVVGAVTNRLAGATNLSYQTPLANIGMDGTKYFAVASNSVGLTASAPATLAVVAPPADAGNVISVQLGLAGGVTGSGGAVTTQPLNSTDLTGAFPATNWNALAATVAGNGSQIFALNDWKGIGNGVNLIVLGASDARYLSATPPDNSPITKLLNTYISGSYPPSQGAANLLGQGMMELVLTNLDNAQTYNVYVYLADDYGRAADVDAGTGVTHYTGALVSTVSSNSVFIASANQDPNDANRDPGNYVHLTEVTPVSGAITVTVNYYDPPWESYGAGVCGLQLVKASADLVSPLVTSQPVSQRVITNNPATFSVGILGTPTPSVQWYQIVGAYQVGSAVTNLIAGANSLSYTTDPVTDATSGRGYFVVVSNAVNSVASQVAFLTAGHMVSSATGFLQLDQYNGATLYDLLDPSYLASRTPDRVRWVSSFQSPGDLPNNSGERLYGWFTPPVTTNYVFFVSSDNNSLLLLSTNSIPEGACQIAEETAYSTVKNNWNNSAHSIISQKRSDQFVYDGSLPGGVWPGGNTISLTAGVQYYIELDHNQAARGSQNASVTYKFDGAPNPANGTATVLTGAQLFAVSAPDYVMPHPQPGIVSAAVSSSTVTLSGTNGLVNAMYYVISSTNVSLPITSWTPGQTAWFGADGAFANVIPRNPSEPGRFYRLSVP